MFKLFFILVFSLNLYSSEFKEISTNLHGNFCGYGTIDKSFDYKSIDAIDDIDKLCQKHDICYLFSGLSKEKCNEILISDLEKLKGKFSNDRCQRLNDTMLAYFKLRNENLKTVYRSNNKTLKKIIKAPKTIFKNSKTLSKVSYDFSLGHFFEKTKRNQFDKNLFKLLPDRFEKCNI